MSAETSLERGARAGGWFAVLGRAASTRRGAIGISLVVPVILLAVVGPWLAPHSTTEFVGLPFARPSAAAWLGTDDVGHDVLSRFLSGGRTIMGLSALATLLGVGAGACLGLIAGYSRGATDEGIMRLLDVALAFPQIIFALLLVSIVGPELWLICLAVAVIHAPQVARVIRAATVQAAEQSFVEYAEMLGAPRRTVIRNEILPNVTSPLLVELGLRFTFSVALVASLAFLGLGLQPPASDWGLMINENRLGIEQNPWGVLAPIAVIAVVTIGANLFSDAVAKVALGVDAPIEPSSLDDSPIGAAA